MMRKILFLVGILGWLVLGGASSGFAQSAKELLDALPAKIRAVAQAKSDGKSVGSGLPNLDFLLDFPRQAREQLDQGQESSAVQLLRALISHSRSDAIRDACEEIINKVQAEGAAQEATASAAATALLQRARDAILSAKAPKDLDAVLLELSRAAEPPRDSRRVSDHVNDALVRRLQNAAKFVSRWQDYLVSVSRNDNRQAAETLRSFTSENNDAIQALGLPRSEIVTRIPSTSQSGENGTPKHSASEIATALNTVLDRTKTLDDLPAALKDVQAIRDELAGGYNGSNTNDVNAALSALQTLYKTRLEFQAGLRTNLMLMTDRYDIGSRISGGIESHLVPLRAQLVALELPRLLGAPAAATPAPGETLDVFWRRLVDDAKKRGDWAGVARGLEIGRELVFTADPQGQGINNSGLDTTGFKNMLAAFNFEQAQQYSQAAAAYLSALNSAVPDLPVALIGDRLAAIKKDHPKDYEEAAHAGIAGDYWSERLRAQYFRVPDPSRAAATPAASVSPTPVPVSPAPSPVASPTPTP